MMGILPVGRLPGSPTPRAAVFWSLPGAALDAWSAAPLADWTAQMHALWPQAAPFVDQIKGHDQMTFAAYSHGHLRRPWQGRVVQIGDAAHRASPQLGQGANMAFLDALALTLALDRAGPDDALRLYARMRRAHVGLYQAMSRFLTPQYQSGSRLPALIRDRLLGPAAHLPPLAWLTGAIAAGTLIPPLSGLPHAAGAPHPPAWAATPQPPVPA
jgi:2-polyprenyl-6-methoxyphenol hydroxylase-like FAD-dependent oxidoreductase